MPYYYIRKGPKELEGILRFTDEHTNDRRIRKSVFMVVEVEKGQVKDTIPVEVYFNPRIKTAGI